MIKDPEKWKVAKLPEFLLQSIDVLDHRTTIRRPTVPANRF
jgi:hypothetical protein